MKENQVGFLVCPDSKCRRALRIKDIFSYFLPDKTEIRDGHLICDGCGQLFPVFMGIPVIVPRLPDYLANHFPMIEAAVESFGGMDRRLFADCVLLEKKSKPGKKNVVLRMTGKQIRLLVENMFRNPNFIHHYDDLSIIIPSGHSLFEFIQKNRRKTPVDILADWISAHIWNRNGIALEIGCGLGGFLPKLSPFSRMQVGLDQSFLPLLLASGILKHLPFRIREYEMQIEKHAYLKRPISQEKMTDLLLVVGNAESLPFAADFFSIVSSLNILDVVDQSRLFLDENLRVLKRNGLLLAASPFDFSEKSRENFGLADSDNIWERIQELMGDRISIIESRDHVPWLLYQYQRYFWIYNNHCFCVRKNG